MQTQSEAKYSDNQWGHSFSPFPAHRNTLSNSTNTASSFLSFSVTATKKLPHCVNVKQRFLTKRGYESFEDWKSDPNHVYNGRDMSHHVPGALGSDWGNPYKVASNASKKSRIRSLKRYEDHIRKKS